MPSAVPTLFLLPALPVGGAERQISALVRNLDRRRFRPIVACQHALGPVAEEIEAAGVPVHLLSGTGRLDVSFLPRTVSLLRRERVRLILTHGFSTGVIGRIAGALAGVPVRILAEHSTGERDMTRVRHRVNGVLRPLASAWVAVAHGQLDYLENGKGIPRGAIRVIPNGIDASPFRPEGARRRIRREFGIPEDAPVAGILAVLRPEKDHRTFLTAARLALDELPDARFLVVGDGPLAGHVRREVDALDLGDHVVLAGRRADIPDVLAAFDVSVLSSTDVETFPLAFLEAMATGLPLIGTRVGGLPEMIAEERNGLLVEPADPQGLARAMLRVLGDRELARTWGAESRRRVLDEFGVEKMVRSYEDLFVELLEARGAWPAGLSRERGPAAAA